MSQLRENFGQVKQMLAMGEELLLVYRSQPLAKISPIKAKRPTAVQQADLTKISANFLEKLFKPIPLGGNWTPKKLKRVYDQQYEKMLP